VLGRIVLDVPPIARQRIFGTAAAANDRVQSQTADENGNPIEPPVRAWSVDHRLALFAWIIELFVEVFYLVASLAFVTIWRLLRNLSATVP
jgi:hypothetical protein